MGAPANIVRQFVEKKGITYPMFLGGEDVLETYDVRAVPLNVFIGRDGEEKRREKGYSEEKQGEFEEGIVKLLKEKG